MNGLALVATLALAQAPAGEEPSPAAAGRDAPAVSTPAAPSARPPTAPAPPVAREEAERAARAFLEALARGDASALAGFAADRFSFDGEVLSGRESIRRTWRELLAARVPAAPAAIGAIEVLQATDAAARYGKPPARIAPLVQRGVMVGIGDVGGRTVVLFLAREHGRIAVLGMHD